MKKIFLISCLAILSFTANAQLGYRYGVIPGIDNTFSVYPREVKAIAYASTVTVTPTQESTTYDFAQLTGAISIVGKVTYAYTGDRMVCLFHADGSDRVVTFSTGITSLGTLTVPATTYSTVMFVFNGSAWYELSRQNNVSGSVTTLLAGNGSVGSPSVSFTNDADCGLYRIGTNNTGIAENGAKVLDIATTGLGVTGVLTCTGLLSPAALINNSAGSAAAPAYSFTGQTDMGHYKISSTQLGASVGGSLVGGWDANGLFTSTITEQITGGGVTFAKQTFTKRTATTYTANATVTSGEIAKGLLTITSGTDTLTLPTGTDLGTALGASAGESFDFTLLNIASGGTAILKANTNAIAGGYGTNTLSLANSASVGAATFRIVFLSATAYIFTRIS